MKIASSLIILLIGLNLAMTGMAVGLCTGMPDCIYCSTGNTHHSHDEPASDGCHSSKPLHAQCDFESNGIPTTYYLDSLTSKGDFREILSIQEAAASVSEAMPAESDQNRFFRQASVALPHRTPPLYLLLLTILR